MRTIFIGDVHGCARELHDLLYELSPQASDKFIFLGDLLDRGPAPGQVVKTVRDLCHEANVECVLGNHEEKALRWLRHEARREANPKYVNPMQRIPDIRQEEWRGLTPEDVAFLQKCPVYVRAPHPSGDFVAIHGGIQPKVDISQQKTGELIRCRWVDDKGEYVGHEEKSIEMPKGAMPWMTQFDGDYHVVCGHAVHSLDKPRLDRSASKFEVWSIDTGCCFGGHLSALVLDSSYPEQRAVVQIKAYREYVALPTGSLIE